MPARRERRNARRRSACKPRSAAAVYDDRRETSNSRRSSAHGAPAPGEGVRCRQPAHHGSFTRRALVAVRCTECVLDLGGWRRRLLGAPALGLGRLRRRLLRRRTAASASISSSRRARRASFFRAEGPHNPAAEGVEFAAGRDASSTEGASSRSASTRPAAPARRRRWSSSAPRRASPARSRRCTGSPSTSSLPFALFETGDTPVGYGSRASRRRARPRHRRSPRRRPLPPDRHARPSASSSAGAFWAPVRHARRAYLSDGTVPRRGRPRRRRRAPRRPLRLHVQRRARLLRRSATATASARSCAALRRWAPSSPSASSPRSRWSPTTPDHESRTPSNAIAAAS